MADNPYKSPQQTEAMERPLESIRAAALRGAKRGGLVGAGIVLAFALFQLGIAAYAAVAHPHNVEEVLEGKSLGWLMLESAAQAIALGFYGACFTAAFFAARARGRRIRSAARKATSKP